MASVDRYRAEARGEGFTLVDDDGHQVTIGRPGFDTLCEAAETSTEHDFLDVICGGDTEPLLDMVRHEDHRVLQAITLDMREFFGVDAAGRLAALLGRYGDHIEADLSPKVDMLDVWRGALSHRKLLNLIDHLPRTSAYQQAIAQDDELADASVTATAEAGAPGIPLSEFSPEVEALAVVIDRLGEVAARIIAANGGKPKPLKPYPRPVTAWERARGRLRKAAIDDLERKLFPPTQ